MRGSPDVEIDSGDNPRLSPMYLISKFIALTLSTHHQHGFIGWQTLMKNQYVRFRIRKI
jgi:hypothetical protein